METGNNPAEDSLQEFHPAGFLASIVESSQDAIFGMTLDCVVASWNKAAEEMYGFAAAEIIGQPVFVLAPPDRLGKMIENLEQVKQGLPVPHLETVRMRKDRTLIDVSIAVSLVRNSAGQPSGIAVIGRNIGEQKRAHQALEMANRAKTQFIDNMNHEIRTPLNGILGMTELVLDSDLTAEQRESLGLVKVSTESLIAAVDDIMDLSQLDSGGLRLESILFDLRESLGDAMKMLGFRAHQKGLELVYEIAPEIPETVLGDPGRIRRILQNLVGNAIKFTDTGEIAVSVTKERVSSKGLEIHFAVRDTGIGIAPQQLQAIFEPFIQADPSMKRRHGGMGLGLTIAKGLAVMAGGRIWAESEVGRGSTFHFTTTLKADEQKSAREVRFDPEGLSGLPILVIDDNALNRRVVRSTLHHWGMRATDVGDGHSALQVMRAAHDIGCPFAVVLLDSHMRDFDGFSLAEEMKKDRALAGAPVMMLTSVGHVGDAARCRDLGIAAYLVKPVRPNELIEAIYLALGKAQNDGAAALVTRHSLRERKSASRVTSLSSEATVTPK